MQFFKNKITLLIFILLFIFSIIFPFYSYANNDTSYVWSEISSPSIATVASLNEDKRKFLESYMW